MKMQRYLPWALLILVFVYTISISIQSFITHKFLFLETEHPTNGYQDKEDVDIIVFSYDRPMQLSAFLDSTIQNVTGIGEIHLIYRSSTDDFERAYATIKKNYTNIIFHRQSREQANDFKPLVLESLKNSSSPFVLFAVDDIIFTKNVDLSKCSKAMKNHKAYTFMLRAGLNLDYDHPLGGKNISYFDTIEDRMIVWTIRNGVRIWRQPHSLDCSIYNKNVILKDIEDINFKAPNSMEDSWTELTFVDLLSNFPTNKKFLKPYTSYFYRRSLANSESCLVNIPINVVNEEVNIDYINTYSSKELLSLFNEGLRINVEKFKNYKNTRVHENLFIDFKESSFY